MTGAAVANQIDDLLAAAQADAFSQADIQSQFRTNKEGNIQASLFNAMLALGEDAGWRGVIGFDEFAYRIVKRRTPPTRVVRIGEWSDLDDVQALAWLSEQYAFEPRKTTVMDAVLQIAHQNTFHPVRDWLKGLEWDGTSRLSGLLSSYFGALPTLGSAPLEDDERREHVKLAFYLKICSVRWLVGAVARIMEPGCKVDSMITLEGPQGAQKSSSLRELFGKEWFADSKITIGDKDALANMQGKWCYEFAEMDAHRKADDTAFKLFLSSQVDRVRWHYGRRAEDVPRQCIFVGTTNMEQYGKDETGMRRIWPVAVGKIDRAAIKADREQLFAEAMHLFQRGVRWWVDRDALVIDPATNPKVAALFREPVTEWALFEEQAAARAIVDAWQYPIRDWLEANDGLPHVTTADVLADALKLDKARWTQIEQKRVGAIMRVLGFVNKVVGPKFKQQRAWVRPQSEANEPGASQALTMDDVDLPL